MVRLLEIQRQELAELDPKELQAFAIALLCDLLDMFESDLATDETMEIERFCKEWFTK